MKPVLKGIGISEKPAAPDSIRELNNEEEKDSDYHPPTYKKKTKLSRSIGASFVTSDNICTRKAALICKELAVAGVDIPTPSQTTIHRYVKKMLNRRKKCTNKI